MGDPVKSLSKVFLKLAVDRNFHYEDALIEGVIELGNDCSDGSPKYQQRHASSGGSFAAPHVDIDTIAMVADPQLPTGPLGGVGSSPAQHLGASEEPDFAEYDFGLTDVDILNLLAGLATKQVAVLMAGSGTGKSTFLPYRLLRPPVEAALRLADRGPIVVTEPRRAAAIDTATFVATKLHNSAVGAGFDVGYRVQDDPAYDANCRLLYVTDGSLINWLRDGSFKRFSTIIVDEAHERSKNIDIILGLLREALPQYPDLRLIVSSATIDASFFIEYFGGHDAVFHMEVPTYKQWGYGMPLWPIEKIDLSRWQGKFGPNGEDLYAITARLVDLRVVDKPIPPGGHFANWRQVMPAMIAKQVLRLLEGTDSGDILAFLPGQRAIDKAVALIREKATDNVDVYALLRTSPEEVQQAAREKKADVSRRRVVVSTNITETSLTIEGMTYVVDSGLINQSQWDVSTASKTIPSVIHSRDGVQQRWGRVGRKMPGWVFPLYTREQFDDPAIFPQHTPPESTRDDLEQFLLAAKGAGIDAPESLVWPASFQRKDSDSEALRLAFQKEMRRADRALRVRGALDEEGDMTPLGSELRVFGGSMAHAIALILGDRMACAIEVATAILLLNRPRLIGTLLLWNKYWKNYRRNEVRRLHEGLWAGCSDDLDLALKVYAAWEASNRPEAWAEEHAVSHTHLMQIRSMREELLESLSPGRIKSSGIRPLFTELAPRVRAVFSRALVDQTYVRGTDGWHPLVAGDDLLKWKIDPLACYTGGDRVIAMQREFTETGVLLSNLIKPSDWAVHSGESWMGFALEANARLSGVRGPNLREHLALLDEWRIGKRYLCVVERENGESRLRAIRCVDEVTQQTSEESLESKSDLIAIAPPEILNIAQLEEFTDLRELEAPDSIEEVPEPPESDYAILAPTSPDPSVPISMPRALTTDSADLPEGEVWIRVLGYQGRGDERSLLVAPYRGDIIGDAPVTNKEEVAPQGLEVTVRAIEKVSRWGSPFLVTLEEQSGAEIVMKPEDLVLNPRMTRVLSIPLGAQFRVTLTKQSQNRRALTASRHTQLAEHLVTIPLSDEWDPPLHSARLLRGIYRHRYVFIALEHEDEASGLLHAYTLERSILQQAGIKIEQGTRLGVQLDLPLSEEGERLARVETKKVPPGLEKILGDKLVRANKHYILRWGALMSVELRNKLLTLSSTSRWHNLVWQLWLKSTEVEVVSVRAAADDTLEKCFPPGRVVAATMDELAPRGGIYVILEGGQRALARNSAIGPRGIRDPKTIFEHGRTVDVRILEITRVDRGKPYIFVAIPAPPSPVEIAGNHLPLKSSVAAIVKYVNDKRGVVLLQLEGGQTALAPKERIGPEGVSIPSKYLEQGTPVTAVIDEIRETDEGEVRIYVSIPSANIPSLLDQLREKFKVRHFR